MLPPWVATATALLSISSAVLAGDNDWQSPIYKDLYSVPLPVPDVKVPIKYIDPPTPNPDVELTFLRSYPYDGAPPIDYYEVEIKPLEAQIYPGLSKTKLVGYDGKVPGPTFHMTQGRESVVRFINNSPMASAIHLHGSYCKSHCIVM
jgi:hypothetical protein